MSAKIHKDTRQRVYERDGERCAACGRPFMLTIQHRVGKGFGGSKEFDGIAYLLTLCGLCNTRLEADAAFKTLGRRRGWSMYRNRVDQDPTTTAVYYAAERAWFLLDDAGGRTEVEAPS